MHRTFEGYNIEIASAIAGLNDQQKFFFATWCCHHLFTTYAQHIPRILSQQDYEVVGNMMQFLLNRVDDFETFNDEDQVYDIVETVREIGPEDQLDLAETADSGINNLLGVIEDTASFLIEKDPQLITTGPDNIIVVIDVIMSFELELDTRDIDRHFNHPLMKEELDRHFQLLDHLKTGARLTSRDIGIYRQ